MPVPVKKKKLSKQGKKNKDLVAFERWTPGKKSQVRVSFLITFDKHVSV